MLPLMVALILLMILLTGGQGQNRGAVGGDIEAEGLRARPLRPRGGRRRGQLSKASSQNEGPTD